MFKFSVVVAVGVAGLAVALMLLYQPPYVYAQPYYGVASGYGETSSIGIQMRSGAGLGQMHQRGWERGGLGNFSASVEVVSLSGRLVELDRGYLVIETDGERLTVKTPMMLSVDGQLVSLVKLAFEDRLNAGDTVQITAHRVTVTRPDGSQSVFYVLKELKDLNTGLEASAATPRLRLSSQPAASVGI